MSPLHGSVREILRLLMIGGIAAAATVVGFNLSTSLWQHDEPRHGPLIWERAENEWVYYERATPEDEERIELLSVNPVANPRMQTVAEWTWAEAWVESDDSELGKKTCAISFGGTVTEIGVDGSRVLVRYQPATAGEGTTGTPCDGGEVLFLNEQTFLTMTARYEEQRKQYIENFQRVNEIRSNPVENPRSQFVNKTQWIEEEPRSSMPNSCLIKAGGQVTEIGVAGEQILVTYQPSLSDTEGTLCDGGEVFFVNYRYFLQMTERFEETLRELAANKTIVERILANPADDPRIFLVAADDWVDPEPRSMEDRSCLTEVGGTMTELGAYGSEVLVRYQPEGVAGGPPECDLDSVYFIPRKQLGDG